VSRYLLLVHYHITPAICSLLPVTPALLLSFTLAICTLHYCSPLYPPLPQAFCILHYPSPLYPPLPHPFVPSITPALCTVHSPAHCSFHYLLIRQRILYYLATLISKIWLFSLPAYIIIFISPLKPTCTLHSSNHHVLQFDPMTGAARCSIQGVKRTLNPNITTSVPDISTKCYIVPLHLYPRPSASFIFSLLNSVSGSKMYCFVTGVVKLPLNLYFL